MAAKKAIKRKPACRALPRVKLVIETTPLISRFVPNSATHLRLGHNNQKIDAISARDSRGWKYLITPCMPSASSRNCVFQKWYSHQAGIGTKPRNGALTKGLTASTWVLFWKSTFKTLSAGG